MSHRHLHHYLERVRARWRDVANLLSVETVSLISLMIIFPLNLRGLGPEGYGQLAVLYVVFGLAGLWINAAPSAAVMQFVLQLEYDGGLTLARARRQVMLSGLAGASLGVAVAVALLGWGILVPAILALFGELLVQSFANLNMATVFAIEGITRSSRLRMFHPIIRAAGVAALAAGGHISITTLVLVNIAAAGTMLWLTGRVVRSRTPVPEGDRQGPTTKEVAKYTSYYGATMSTNAVQDEGEKLILSTFRPATEIGQYAAAYRIVSVTLVPLSAVSGAANRWFLTRDEREGAQLTRAVRLAVVTTIYGLVIAALLLAGGDLIQWVVGPEFDDVQLIVAWLCLLPLLHGLAELPAMALIGLGRNRERMLMGIATAVLAAVSYLALVPWLGWRGAVLGTYISETAMIVAGFALLVRYQRAADRKLVSASV